MRFLRHEMARTPPDKQRPVPRPFSGREVLLGIIAAAALSAPSTAEASQLRPLSPSRCLTTFELMQKISAVCSGSPDVQQCMLRENTEVLKKAPYFLKSKQKTVTASKGDRVFLREERMFLYPVKYRIKIQDIDSRGVGLAIEMETFQRRIKQMINQPNKPVSLGNIVAATFRVEFGKPIKGRLAPQHIRMHIQGIQLVVLRRDMKHFGLWDLRVESVGKDKARVSFTQNHYCLNGVK